jgi:hypothetical protein
MRAAVVKRLENFQIELCAPARVAKVAMQWTIQHVNAALNSPQIL